MGTSDRFTADDSLVLTNLNKVFWPEAGYTKGDLIAYYRAIAPVMLPYLADRPQVLYRHVDGHSGKEFYQRVSRHSPPWLQVVRLSLEGGREMRDFHLCQDWATLLWMANFGCIEFGPWAARVGSLDRPDYLVIDLDPGDVPFSRVIEAAIMTRKVLDKAGAASCCKTSGKRGLHVYVPLGQKYSFPQVKLAADILARLIHRQLPATTTLDSRPEKRQGRIYLDTTRNARGQAVAVAYCARPHPGATVSAPLKWSEVRPGLDPAKYTIKTMPRRIDRLGDLWQAVLGPGIDLADCLQRLEKQFRNERP